LASVTDWDFLPYTLPVSAATTARFDADGTNELTVWVDDNITTTGVNVTIPVTATGSGTLPAYSITVNVPSYLTQDGISRDVIFSWEAQAYTAATKSITANFKAVGGTLDVIFLDINRGIGNDNLGVVLGTFNYPYNNAGDLTTYELRAIPGIPDKMFGKTDNGGVMRHNFLYLPMVAEDGKIWLNHNLGADYSNIDHASFKPTQPATSASDYHAYGSLFQWGRKPDGHELITWINASTGTVVNGTTTTNSDIPGDALFITEPSSPYDWRVTSDNNLWINQSSTNNPCPRGYRVPTQDELNSLFTAAGITTVVNAASSILKFTAVGSRDGTTGTMVNSGTIGSYWNSTTNGIYARYRFIDSFTSNAQDDLRADANVIRCIQN